MENYTLITTDREEQLDFEYLRDNDQINNEFITEKWLNGKLD